MKKIYLLIAAVGGALVACDPVSEDISVSGNITADQLKSMSTVLVDKASSGQNGNVITCTTSAPVNAKWTIDGKDLLGNSAWKKMKIGEYTVTLTGLCADGSVVTVDFPVKCDEITNPLERYWIYGKDPAEQGPLTLSGDAGYGRFSDNEGKGLPYLTDEVYWGFKTLIFDVVEAADGPFIWGDGVSDVGCTMRVMNGWWGATYADDVPVKDQIKNGKWELQLTEDIAKDCARGGGGAGKDLDLLMTRGTVTISSVYYEE